MDIKILASFIKKCFELGIPSSDCSELIDLLDPEPIHQVMALKMWLDREDENEL
jgi:hypothetical protein